MWEKIHDTGFGNNFLDGIATKPDKWDYIKLRKNHNNQENAGAAQRSYPTIDVRGCSQRSNPMPEVRGGSHEEQPHDQQPHDWGQGWHLRGATTGPRSGARPRGTRSGAAAERSNPTSKEPQLCAGGLRGATPFKVRRGGREEIILLQGKEQRLGFAGAAIKRYPTPKVTRNPSKMGRCCERASEGRQTETIITENYPIWSQDHSCV